MFINKPKTMDRLMKEENSNPKGNAIIPFIQKTKENARLQKQRQQVMLKTKISQI